jgi:hypothetical protein
VDFRSQDASPSPIVICAPTSHPSAIWVVRCTKRQLSSMDVPYDYPASSPNRPHHRVPPSINPSAHPSDARSKRVLLTSTSPFHLWFHFRPSDLSLPSVWAPWLSLPLGIRLQTNTKLPGPCPPTPAYPPHQPPIAAQSAWMCLLAASGPGLIPKCNKEDWRTKCHARNTDGFGSPFGLHSSLFSLLGEDTLGGVSIVFIVC